MATHCRVIQVLEPSPPSNLTIQDDDDSLAVEESGTVVLAVNVTEYAVVFQQAKLNADYAFTEDDISNAVDGGDQLEIGYTMDERTVDGFTLRLDAAPDTVNYRFNYTVRVPTV